MLPSIDMKKMIVDLGIQKKFDTIIVTQLKYSTVLDSFLINTPIADLKTLLRWDTFNSNAGKLTTEIDKANWSFYSKYLRGSEKQRPADERALQTVKLM